MTVSSLCTGCQEPPAEIARGISGPPVLASLSDEERQEAIAQAETEPRPAYFVIPPEPKAESDAAGSNKIGDVVRARKVSQKKPAARKGKKDENTETEAAFKKPKSYGRGMIATPLTVFRGAESQINKLAFDKALQTYKTLNGKLPQTQKVFMDEIIVKHQIKLPKLRDGESYRFDPDEGPLGTLMIVKPKTLQEKE